MRTFRTLGRAVLVACLGFAVLAGTACTQDQLTQAGLPAGSAAKIAVVSQDMVAAGQLFCQAGGMMYQAGAVKVTSASAASVAAACTALQIGAALAAQAHPVAVMPGQSVVVAPVAPEAAAAVVASVKP